MLVACKLRFFLVYELVGNDRFSYELANREKRVRKVVTSVRFDHSVTAAVSLLTL